MMVGMMPWSSIALASCFIDSPGAQSAMVLRHLPAFCPALRLSDSSMLNKAPSLSRFHAPETAVVARAGRREPPTCSLERLPRRTLERLVPRRPTREQWLAHWGRTGFERQGHIMQAILAGILCVWGGWFASRTILGPTAWKFSCLAYLLQVALGPVFAAYGKLSEVWGGRPDRRTRGALFSGRVTRTGSSVDVEDAEHHMHFKMLVEDEEGRELIFDVPQVPEYRGVERGMRCEVVVFSKSSGFKDLDGVTDAYIPALNLFVGQFPYLEKRAFWNLLASRYSRNRQRAKEQHARLKGKASGAVASLGQRVERKGSRALGSAGGDGVRGGMGRGGGKGKGPSGEGRPGPSRRREGSVSGGPKGTALR